MEWSTDLLSERQEEEFLQSALDDYHHRLPLFFIFVYAVLIY